MKIAIMTQPLGHNYGGIIQNYALQRVLKDLGHEPITINRIKSVGGVKAVLKKSRLIIKLYELFSQKHYLSPVERQVIMKNNIRFIEENIRRSDVIKSTEGLSKYFAEKNFNAVIVGSDQTWRPRYSPDIYNYYLDFLENNHKIIKLAYASSFGTSEWEYSEEQTLRCNKLAKEFDAVSVREDSGINLCATYLGINAQHVLDPSLLLSSDDYSEIIQRPKQNKELFTYILDNNKSKDIMINDCAKRLGLNITNNQANHKFTVEEKRPLKDYTIPPIEGWLQGFRDAEFVITDSFHGTAFSVINQKPFLALINEKRGASRFISFLGALGLTDRMIVDVTEVDFNILQKKIDYSLIHKRLRQMKEKSIEFLQENLIDT